MASLAAMAVVKFQLRRLSRGGTANPNVSPLKALVLAQLRTALLTRKYRRWIASSANATAASHGTSAPSRANVRAVGMPR